ncbi:MAG: TorF family putative porin [Halioglobus sp.]|nr:TorF family putative porin [Halioglobus sp.]
MFNKKLLPAALATALVSGMAAAPATADLSANIGFASEYYFRGLLQNDSSASAGLDFESNGFYVGTWAADVGDGLEVDLYGGYGIEVEGFSFSVGGTGYYYTGDFDDTYQELNLGAGYDFISVDYAIGEWDGFGDEQNYDILTVGLAYEGFFGTWGSWGVAEDELAEGDYFELGYGTEIGGFDVSVYGVYTDEDLTGGDEWDEALLFTVGKSFDL